MLRRTAPKIRILGGNLGLFPPTLLTLDFRNNSVPNNQYKQAERHDTAANCSTD